MQTKVLYVVMDPKADTSNHRNTERSTRPKHEWQSKSFSFLFFTRVVDHPLGYLQTALADPSLMIQLIRFEKLVWPLVFTCMYVSTGMFCLFLLSFFSLSSSIAVVGYAKHSLLWKSLGCFGSRVSRCNYIRVLLCVWVPLGLHYARLLIALLQPKIVPQTCMGLWEHT